MDTNRDVNAETVEKVDTDEKEKDEKDEKKRGRGCGCWIALLLFLLAGGGATAYVGGTTLLRTEKPLPLEPQITDLAKRWIMIPGEYVDRRMPERDSINVATGKKLYDEGDYQGRELVGCNFCHGPSGIGDSKLGASMYPPAINLKTDPVRTKTEGQLYWLIAHGINLTGMPAFGEGYVAYGKGYTEDEIWSLVKYIREELQKEKQ